MEKISFCIATAKNEKEYLKLLLKSLRDNTNLDNHEIVVWIDTDNQDTYGELQTLKSTDFPMLTFCKNPYPAQLGNQLNSSVMVNEAKNDIICFLHSDMVVGKNFDVEILRLLGDDEKNIVCNARIEPPLHPDGPEKIVKDFGLTPEEFKYDEFQTFSEGIDKENYSGYLAPCTFYKKTFLDVLGGFDTIFRCSKEDSDFILKIGMNELNPIITWKAVVYHFTCVSSRGKDWYKKQDDITATNHYQVFADKIETKRFYRKWGFFGHEYKQKYDIGLSVDVDCVPNFEVLFLLEPHFNRIIFNDDVLTEHFRNQLIFESSYYSNKKLGFSSQAWNEMKDFYKENWFNDRIIYSDTLGNNSSVIVKTKMSELIRIIKELPQEFQSFIINVNTMINQNKSGNYQLFDGIELQINDNLQDLNSNHNKNDNIHKILKKMEYNFE